MAPEEVACTCKLPSVISLGDRVALWVLSAWNKKKAEISFTAVFELSVVSPAML